MEGVRQWSAALVLTTERLPPANFAAVYLPNSFPIPIEMK